MTDQQLTTITKQMDSLPALPATVANVLAVTTDPNSSANDLIQAILPDQTMCSTILKVANSAFFGIPRQVSTIERAVTMLGYDEIRNIVLGKAIFASFPRLSQDHRHTVSLFWEHAFTCGLAAKLIGDHLHLAPSELFIAGLIHDIGKLVMLMAFPADYPVLPELANLTNLDSNSEECARFGISHDQVGLQLAEKWGFPEPLSMAIGFHHFPQKAPRSRQYPLIVQVADILSLIYCHGETIDRGDVQRIFHDFLPELSSLWSRNNLSWQPENSGCWFELLQQHRESDRDILSIFSSP